MTLSLRRRRASVAVAALVAGTPPLVSGVAMAEPAPPPGMGVRETDRVVTFGSSGPGALRCVSSSEATSITVPPESTVRVVNDTGRRARLLLDGVARGELPAGSSADLLFHHGPVSLALRPICVFPAESAVRVEVGSPSHGPDAAGLMSTDAPLNAMPGAHPPPDRLGGAPAELVRPVDPVRPAGPVGLLALIATVCVVGVSAGAIRAILAQRATRTVVA
ncbi:hypothetical protein [Plantactinospora soyae]|uniref:Uncharacterized protein n=1 Tax=Plantactinospora soyae TaxID=1544732 RepID=A0A927M3E9_9ACTN|nr:hypothetical protein [Plantactinospora soyae]MBE1486071.1 hypothetical protein [Plantactinospora soyae]